MILLSLTLPVSALSLSAANSQDKIDATLKEKMATASPDEKIPVAIWYEDVDQNKIDTLTAKEVGFSEEEIDVDYEMPSTELLTSLKAEEAGAVDEMEDINFRRGDANMDGKLTPSDATLIQRYLALHEGVELNNQQLFLADANYDGQVTSADATHIGKMLSDLIIY